MTDTKQPEALRLALSIDVMDTFTNYQQEELEKAAAELRRLHAENTTLQQGYDAARMEIDSLRTQLKHAELAADAEARMVDERGERIQELVHQRDAAQEVAAMNAARVQELESQLEAIGAGGVEPLRSRCLHQIAEPAQADPAGRTPNDYAIEHAEYMAQAAERLLDAINNLNAQRDEDGEAFDQDALNQAQESVTEAFGAVRSGIYEFRKRRDRALAYTAAQTLRGDMRPDPNAYPVPQPPAGWVMVPVEPTEEMIIAGVDASLRVADAWLGDDDSENPHVARWFAMLAAAPKAEPAQPAVEPNITRFNPVDGSPATALQMAAVIALHDADKPAGEYPALPEPAFRLFWDGDKGCYRVTEPGIEDVQVYTDADMRAYADATCAKRAAQFATADNRAAFKAYLEDCDECAIVPDIAGAFNAGWTSCVSAEQPAGAQAAPAAVAGPSEADTIIRALLDHIERNTCEHHETYRGGAIWEICSACGAKWADDEGGKPTFEWPAPVERAREFLLAAPTTQAAPQPPAAVQEPYAYAVYFPDQPTIELVHDLDDLTDDLTNRDHQITKLYTHPAPADAEAAPAAVAIPLTKLQRKAIAVCFTSDKVSVSEVQRKLSISYADAQTLCQSIVDLGLTDELELAPSLKRGAPTTQAAPGAQGDALTPAEADQLEKAITDFEECGETDVPDAALQRFAAMGYLECVHYNVLPAAHKAIDAARSQKDKEGCAA